MAGVVTGSGVPSCGAWSSSGCATASSPVTSNPGSALTEYGHPFAFFVSIQRGATELERHSQFRPVEGRMPEKTFERELWKA